MLSSLWGPKQAAKVSDEAVRFNSSMQVAKNARAHHNDIKKSKKAHLLTLPGEVRARIIREIVVNEETSITVSGHAQAASREPHLTNVCHDLREQTLPVYYQENDFVVQIINYDVQAVLPWLKRYESFQCTPSGGRQGNIIIRTDGVPHWQHLQQWLKLAHVGEVTALQNDDFEGGEQDAAVKGAFTAVLGLKLYPWTIVAHTLPGLQQMLADGDPRWAVDDVDEAVVGTSSTVPVPDSKLTVGDADLGTVNEHEFLAANTETQMSGTQEGYVTADEHEVSPEDTVMPTAEELEEVAAADDSGITIDDSDDALVIVPVRKTQPAGTKRRIEDYDSDENDPPAFAAVKKRSLASSKRRDARRAPGN